MSTPAGAEPLVSVVVIFRDEERFLPEAVESVMGQTYRSWELILVDDGSRDGSGPWARQLASACPGRVRLLSHPGSVNRGMSASRNLGIAAARGAYVVMLDGDDRWEPTKLSVQIDLLERTPEAGCLVAPALYWWSWTGLADTTDRLQQVAPDGLSDGAVVEPPGLLPRFLRDEWSSWCDVVVRREAASAIGGYEPRFTGMFEDQVFHAKLCLASPIVLSRSCGYLYRQHPDACTAQSHRAGQWRSARRIYLHWLRAYAEDQGADDELLSLVRSEQRRLGLPGRARSKLLGAPR